MAYNNGKCNVDPNKCRSQVALNRLLKDPVLGPFLESRVINEEDKSSATKLGGYGWISLPTTTKSGVNEDKAKLNSVNDQINFFSVKRYTPEDSKVIYEALTSSMSSGKGNGQDIIFDQYGNFAYWNGEINKILHNPIVPRSSSIDLVLNAADGGNTLYEKYTKFFSGTNIYYYNTKMIANPQMTYLILTKDTVPSENSIYYLVYNPIHRQKFRDYYSHLIGYEGIWEGSKLIKPGSVGAFQNSNVPTVPSVNGGQVKEAPSYKKTLARYCNAIKIGGDTLPNGKRAEHYADPTCNFAMDKNEADFSLISGQNFTQSNLAYDRYAPINGTAADGKARFLSSKNILMRQPGNNELHWPCKAEWDKNLRTSIEYADYVGLFGARSKSFVNLLANAHINKIGIGGKNALNIGGENFDEAPMCPRRSVNITSCVNHVDIAGNAKGNDISMQTACGANQAPVKTTDTTPNKPLVPGQQQTVPGQQQTVPGQQQTVPGQQQTVPGQQQTVPGQQQTVDGEPGEETDNTMLYIIIAVLLLLVIIGLIIFL
jgi:hypothetical protein